MLAVCTYYLLLVLIVQLGDNGITRVHPSVIRLTGLPAACNQQSTLIGGLQHQ